MRALPLVLAACAPAPAAERTNAAPQEQPVPASLSAITRQPPYLSPAALGDTLVLFPPPPAAGSAALARDEAGARDAFALRSSPRFALAARDADLASPDATGALSCAAGVRIGPQSTPLLDRMLRRLVVDFGMSTGAAKDHYARPRPFMVNNQPTCTPQDEPFLRKNGAYPSGHSAAGFGWALVLAELMPERAAGIVARGRAFGDSRRVCNVHWTSDVEEGRIAAAAVFARLQTDPSFRTDLDAVRAELAGVKAKPDAAACANEAAALAAGG